MIEANRQQDSSWQPKASLKGMAVPLLRNYVSLHTVVIVKTASILIVMFTYRFICVYIGLTL